MITPTANSAAMMRVQRRASVRYSAIARAQVQPLDEQDHRREGDAEAHERDVHGERQSLHLSRLQQVRLVRGGHRNSWYSSPAGRRAAWVGGSASVLGEALEQAERVGE